MPSVPRPPRLLGGGCARASFYSLLQKNSIGTLLTSENASPHRTPGSGSTVQSHAHFPSPSFFVPIPSPCSGHSILRRHPRQALRVRA
eukprot:scaffold28033_cov152-Isochrysis_galbana.AAC.3